MTKTESVSAAEITAALRRTDPNHDGHIDRGELGAHPNEGRNFLENLGRGVGGGAVAIGSSIVLGGAAGGVIGALVRKPNVGMQVGALIGGMGGIGAAIGSGYAVGTGDREGSMNRTAIAGGIGALVSGAYLAKGLEFRALGTLGIIGASIALGAAGGAIAEQVAG